MPRFYLYFPLKPHRVSQKWGIKNDAYQRFGFSRHNGLDIIAHNGQLISSPGEYTVSKIGWQDKGAGLYITLLSEQEFDWEDKKTFVELGFYHLSSTIAKVGDKVRTGDPIAYADNTGFSTGPHTHLAPKRVYKLQGGYINADENDANGTFDPEPFFNGLYAQDSRDLPAVIKLLTAIRDALKAKANKKTKLELWADAIEKLENLDKSFNNPGALRYSPFQAGQRIQKATGKPLAFFDTYEDGRKGLIYQLTIAVDGRSEVYNPEMTLLQFYEKYAPREDGNKPEKYAAFVANYIGVPVETQIKTLL